MSGARHTRDDVLVHRALLGERNGATRLVAKYQRMVTAHLARCVRDEDQARDLAQESFLAAFRNLARLRDLEQFKAWLMRIAHRSFLAHRRAAAPAAPLDASLPEVAGNPEDDPLEVVTSGHDLRGLVERLPEPYRTTVEQRFYRDLPIAEVARRQGIDLPLAKYRIRHAVGLLRRQLSVLGVKAGDL